MASDKYFHSWHDSQRRGVTAIELFTNPPRQWKTPLRQQQRPATIHRFHKSHSFLPRFLPSDFLQSVFNGCAHSTRKSIRKFIYRLGFVFPRDVSVIWRNWCRSVRRGRRWPSSRSRGRWQTEAFKLPRSITAGATLGARRKSGAVARGKQRRTCRFYQAWCEVELVDFVWSLY